MLARFSLAHWFLIGGAVVALLGLIVWFAFPIPSTWPPFLATAVLALGYGLYCLKKDRPINNDKR